MAVKPTASRYGASGGGQPIAATSTATKANSLIASGSEAIGSVKLKFGFA